jgi:Ohr subfamily peroxiredoxin
MKALYEAHASATAGRNGRVATDDGIIDLQLALPKGLGGAGGAAANPEQLFACGYAACFDSALNFVAMQQKIKLSGTRVDATVGIGPNATGGFGLAVKLAVTIPDLPREQAQALLEKAHATCPYSNAIRGNVNVELELR